MKTRCPLIALVLIARFAVAAPETRQPAAAASEKPPAAILPDAVARFLETPPVIDKDWPPDFTRWVFVSSGPLSSDAWLYAVAGIPDQLAVEAAPKTWKAYFHGRTDGQSATPGGKPAVWNGKAVCWRLQDSRALVANAVFKSARASSDPKTAPRACVAVHALADGKLLASIEVPLVNEETTVRLMKHFSYNRLTLLWLNTGVKRGFTIPDHVPLRLVIGVTAAAPNEEIAVTLEIQEGGHL